MAEQDFRKHLKIALKNVKLSNAHKTSTLLVAWMVTVAGPGLQTQTTWQLSECKASLDLDQDVRHCLTTADAPNNAVSVSVVISAFFWRCKTTKEIEFIRANYDNPDPKAIHDAYKATLEHEEQEARQERERARQNASPFGNFVSSSMATLTSFVPDLSNDALTVIKVSHALNMTEENGNFRLHNQFDDPLAVQFAARGPVDGTQLAHGITIDLEALYVGTTFCALLNPPKAYEVRARFTWLVYRSH